MTPSARMQAAIDILDEVIAAAGTGGAAADKVFARYFKERRYAGSKDRRSVRELVYRAIRRAGDRPVSGRAAMLGVASDDPALDASFDGSVHGAAAIQAGEPTTPASLVPAWLSDRLAATLGEDEVAALLARAPLDVRVNRLKATRTQVLAELPQAVPTRHAPDGVRLPEGTQVHLLHAGRKGWIEVQDEGSQIVSAAAGAAPGDTVVDLCAGAGGKTLAMAAAMENEGRIIACDTDRGRLSRLPPRAARAGVSIAETRLLDPGREHEALQDLAASADLVVIDAPCSGTGTWRRNPEARWWLTPARLQRFVDTQARLLEIGVALVRPGGRMAYITCSLLEEEGRMQIERFLAEHGGWKVEPISVAGARASGPGLRLTPLHDGTDGFFVATLRRA